MSERIEKITVHRLRLPLSVPYKLAFGPVKAFDTVVVEVIDRGGHRGFGEATILTGYTSETIEGCWREVCDLADRVSGMAPDDAMTVAFSRLEEAPFSVTAVVSAVEMMAGCDALMPPGPADVPLLAILNAMDKDGIRAEVRELSAAGYKTIKVKVGWDADDDLERVSFIQSCLPDDVRIRIDGNQGFSQADGVNFASGLSPDNVELLEQPCHMDDWQAADAVSRVATVPFMLDESIYGEDEIDRAAEMGTVSHIKLKLMKAGSVAMLEHQLRKINQLGMTAVLGNGVAADIGCWMEACVANRLIDNAGEMNGFLKPELPIFADPMHVADGNIHLAATSPRLIDLDRIAVAVHSARG